MALNDTSANGRSPRRTDLEEQRFWVWESALRGLTLTAYLDDDNNATALGLRSWSDKEKQQRGTFRYAHLGERMGYRRPDTLIDKLKTIKSALAEERRTGEPSPAPLPPVLGKETDRGLHKAVCRLELACRFPWRTAELFGWDDQAMMGDEAETLSFPAVDFSTQARIKETIVDPITRMRPAAGGGAPEPASPKSAYWLRMVRDLGDEKNPPLEHQSLMKDTADFSANYYLRLLYLFGPMPAAAAGRENPILIARQKRRTFDEPRFVAQTLTQLAGGKPLDSLPAEERARLQVRVLRYLTRLKDPAPVDLRFSSAIAELIKQAMLRFKYWLDEPFSCSKTTKLHDARRERGFNDEDTQAEMTFWSENHYVLFAAAEYLAGQLWPQELFVPGKDFQDPKNFVGAIDGTQRMRRARPRLLKWLNHRIALGWSEWNAPGYYEEHAEALYNLVDFCLDEEIRTKAAIALDLLAFDVARLNHRGSFGVAGGRAQSKFKVSGWEQSPGDWVEFLFARRGAFAENPSNLTVIAAGSSYQVPDVILDIGASLPSGPVIDKSRVSVHFNEQKRYGIRSDNGQGLLSQMREINHQIATNHQRGYNQADDDTVFWWGRGAYFNKQVIDDTVRVMNKYGLDTTAPFVKYGELFGGGMNTGEDFAVVGGSVLGVALAGGAGPAGVLVGAAGGAFGMGKIIGKGALRPAIMAGRIGASTAGLMLLGLPGVLLSIFTIGWPFGDDKAHANDISLFVEGSTLSRANLYTWRDRGAMLSSVLDFRPTQLNFQENACQATLSADASVWSNSPFSGASIAGVSVMPADHVDGVGWFTGNWSSPRVVQFENAAILAYRPVGFQNKLHANASHCWFPQEAFVDFVEGVRSSNVEGEDHGTWAFGKIVHPDGVEGYVGVFSARDADFLNKDSAFYQAWMEKEVKKPISDLNDKRNDDDKPAAERQEAARQWVELVSRWASGPVVDFFARKDLYAKDDNIWIIQVGSSDEFGTFQAFKDEVTRARIHINFGDMQCSYDIPRRGRLELHTDIDDDEAAERGRFRFRGDRLATDYYPRFSSPFVRAGRVEWGQANFAIEWGRSNAWYLLDRPDEPVRILNKTHGQEEARLLRAFAIRIRTEHENMDDDTVAKATVRAGGREIVSHQVVARGEVDEHTDHDVEWMFIPPTERTGPLTIEIEHVASSPSGDDEPHWRMRFELWALTGDARLLPCTVDLSKAKNYSTRKVRHLNFEDEHRRSGEMPITIPT